MAEDPSPDLMRIDLAQMAIDASDADVKMIALTRLVSLLEREKAPQRHLLRNYLTLLNMFLQSLLEISKLTSEPPDTRVTVLMAFNLILEGLLFLRAMYEDTSELGPGVCLTIAQKSQTFLLLPYLSDPDLQFEIEMAIAASDSLVGDTRTGRTHYLKLAQLAAQLKDSGSVRGLFERIDEIKVHAVESMDSCGAHLLVLLMKRIARLAVKDAPALIELQDILAYKHIFSYDWKVLFAGVDLLTEVSFLSHDAHLQQAAFLGETLPDGYHRPGVVDFEVCTGFSHRPEDNIKIEAKVIECFMKLWDHTIEDLVHRSQNADTAPAGALREASRRLYGYLHQAQLIRWDWRVNPRPALFDAVRRLVAIRQDLIVVEQEEAQLEADRAQQGVEFSDAALASLEKRLQHLAEEKSTLRHEEGAAGLTVNEEYEVLIHEFQNYKHLWRATHADVRDFALSLPQNSADLFIWRVYVAFLADSTRHIPSARVQAAQQMAQVEQVPHHRIEQDRPAASPPAAAALEPVAGAAPPRAEPEVLPQRTFPHPARNSGPSATAPARIIPAPARASAASDVEPDFAARLRAQPQSFAQTQPHEAFDGDDDGTASTSSQLSFRSEVEQVLRRHGGSITRTQPQYSSYAKSHTSPRESLTTILDPITQRLPPHAPAKTSTYRTPSYIIPAVTLPAHVKSQFHRAALRRDDSEIPQPQQTRSYALSDSNDSLYLQHLSDDFAELRPSKAISPPRSVLFQLLDEAARESPQAQATLHEAILNSDPIDLRAVVLELQRLSKSEDPAAASKANLSLGYMHEMAYGVPESYEKAAEHYQHAGAQNAAALSHLGWLHLNGFGVEKSEALALEKFYQSGEGGHARGWTNVGYCHQAGCGVPVDLPAAMSFYKRAADMGDPRGQTNLGWCYGSQSNDVAAVRYYTLAARQGDARGQTNLGWCYESGFGVAVNETEAARLYKLAADQGDAVGQNNIGWCYASGLGVPQDWRRAAFYYTLAANQGQETAMYNLALCYARGNGVSQDLEAAARCFALVGCDSDGNPLEEEAMQTPLATIAPQAPQPGNLHAVQSKQTLKQESQAEPAEAVATSAPPPAARAPGDFSFLTQKAAISPYWQAGADLAQNPIAVVELYRQGAAQGDPEAVVCLGWCYENGYGVERNVDLAAELYKTASDQGYARGEVSLGWCYENGVGVIQDWGQAVKYYRRASDKGDARGMACLGYCLEGGKGVEKDISAAVELYKSAAAKHDGRGLTLLGQAHEQGLFGEKQEDLAFQLYKQAAEVNYAQGLTCLGFCFENGVGTAPSTSMAVQCYRAAAEQNDALGLSHLASCYARGLGVAKDYRQAAFYFQRAAELNLPIAQVNLGVLYKHGLGVEKDIDKALYFFKLASDSGDALAKTQLGKCYLFGEGVKKSNKRALEMFRTASEQNEPLALHFLGIMHKNGDGVPIDHTAAFHFFRRAVDGGCALARPYLGWCYEKGEGTAPDTREAVRQYQLAADAGDRLGQALLGCCYDLGVGVGVDHTRAAEWYTKAADQGDPTAQNNLAYAYTHGRGVETNLVLAAQLYQGAADQGDAKAQWTISQIFKDGKGVPVDIDKYFRYLQLAARNGHARAQVSELLP
eukprot:TRINITY_DN3415_c0_g1_i2.p1 TRINITY_DN3415_c0_g1~~TRINITY_DN3415_c0_g1_i2.p1  ORF type:complete len:1615 (-),score=355.02 TRINITY_DN3415_c0_g1_i2:314-5158(-)